MHHRLSISRVKQTRVIDCEFMLVKGQAEDVHVWLLTTVIGNFNTASITQSVLPGLNSTARVLCAVSIDRYRITRRLVLGWIWISDRTLSFSDACSYHISNGLQHLEICISSNAFNRPHQEQSALEATRINNNISSKRQAATASRVSTGFSKFKGKQK
ncbi:hypothetical protein Tco_0534686 [Tanacetum coccineum]